MNIGDGCRWILVISGTDERKIYMFLLEKGTDFIELCHK